MRSVFQRTSTVGWRGGGRLSNNNKHGINRNTTTAAADITIDPKISRSRRRIMNHNASVQRTKNENPDGQRSRCSRRTFGVWWKKAGVPLAIFGAGVSVCFLFTDYNIVADHQYLLKVFSTMGEAVATGMFVAFGAGIEENSIATTVEILSTLSAPYLSEAMFSRLAEGLLTYVGNETTLAYLPRIRAENLTSFLEYANTVYPDLSYGEYRIQKSNPAGGLIPRENTTLDIYPLLYQAPLNPQILGYDFYAEPVRKETLDQVLESYSPRATEGVVLADTGLPGIIFLQPVVLDGEVESLVAKVLRVTAVVEEVTATQKFFEAMPNSNLRVFLRTSVDHVQLLHDHVYYERGVVQDLAYTGSVPQTSLSPLGISSVSFSYSMTPTRELIVVLTATFTTSWSEYLPLLIGSLLSFVLALMTHKRLGLLLDLQEALDESERQSRFKSQFVADISHEIRTPMNGVIGMAELLIDQPLTPAAREYATVIMSCGTILSGLISDILDFSKIAAGKVVLQATRTYLRTLFFDISQVMRATYKAPPNASSVFLRLYVDSSVPKGMVDVDEIRLRQIIVNLVSNALKFTDEGYVNITISCDRQPAGPGVVRPGPLGSRGRGRGEEARREDETRHPKYACCRGAWWSCGCCRDLAVTGSGDCWESPGRHRDRNIDTEDGSYIASLPTVSGWNNPHEARGSGTSTNGNDCENPTMKGGFAHNKFAKLTVSVSDTGIGISPEVLGGLFSPFVQGVRTARSLKVGGTGLGLTISKSLVQLMGGDISCTSEIGNGSTFTFTVLVGLLDNSFESTAKSSVDGNANVPCLGLEGCGEPKGGGAEVPAPQREVEMKTQGDGGDGEWTWDLSKTSTSDKVNGVVGTSAMGMMEVRRLAEKEAFQGAGSESSLGSRNAIRMLSNASNDDYDNCNNARSLSNASRSKYATNRLMSPASRSSTCTCDLNNTRTSRLTANNIAGTVASQKAPADRISQRHTPATRFPPPTEAALPPGGCADTQFRNAARLLLAPPSTSNSSPHHAGDVCQAERGVLDSRISANRFVVGQRRWNVARRGSMKGVDDHGGAMHAVREVTSSQEGDAGERPHILVVDDSRINRLLLSRMLGELDMAVVTANDGEEAVRACSVQQFSAILMDMCMPVMDGIEATITIRASNGPNANTPIVFVTATASDDARIACTTAGATGYITKPFKRSVIIVKLANCLKPKEVLWIQAGWMRLTNSTQQWRSTAPRKQSSETVSEVLSLQHASTQQANTTTASAFLPTMPDDKWSQSSGNNIPELLRLQPVLAQHATMTTVEPAMPKTSDHWE